MQSKIIHGEALEELKKLEENSIDLIACDPPYAISFMGKAWDKALPSVDVWKECLRVLKPGAFAFVMSAPRSDVCSRMSLRLEEAGFNISFTPIYWTYASGFPKAMNIGKMVDKRMGRERKEVKGQKASTMGSNTMDGGKANPNYKHSKGNHPLEGSYGGFQPKPAVEVIIVAMKPLSEKTYVDQALKNGKGVTWLDDCRVPTNNTEKEVLHAKASKNPTGVKGYFVEGIASEPHDKGRFPANLICSDDVLNDGRTTKANATKRNRKTIGSFGMPNDLTPEYSDSGSYSRYFSLDSWAQNLPFLQVAKASKSEKNRGLEGMEDKERTDYGGFHSEEGLIANGRNPENRKGAKNNHPTVKPLKLMSYLITLGSREGDTVLDPFAGSCTTLVAAQELKRNYIGIEREVEYVKICEARLKIKQPTLL